MDDEARLADELKKLERDQQRKRKELELLAKQKREDAAKAASRHALFFSFLVQLMFVIVFFWRIVFSVSFCPAVPKEMDSQIKQCQQLSVEMDELIVECTETLEKIIEKKKSLDDILKDLATRT